MPVFPSAPDLKSHTSVFPRNQKHPQDLPREQRGLVTRETKAFPWLCWGLEGKLLTPALIFPPGLNRSFITETLQPCPAQQLGCERWSGPVPGVFLQTQGPELTPEFPAGKSGMCWGSRAMSVSGALPWALLAPCSHSLTQAGGSRVKGSDLRQNKARKCNSLRGEDRAAMQTQKPVL